MVLVDHMTRAKCHGAHGYTRALKSGQNQEASKGILIGGTLEND